MRLHRPSLITRVIGYAKRKLMALVYRTLLAIPYFHFIKNTQDYQAPHSFRLWFFQKVLGFNRAAHWPVHFTSRVTNPRNIVVGVDAYPGYEPGCYVQGVGRIEIGDYTQVGQNVGLISGNHDPYDLRSHEPSEVRIGQYCWLGMNSVVLPGVDLGDFTIVGAGSVVTKSFPEGYCVIAGNPAKQIRRLKPEECTRHTVAQAYEGYQRR